jgi:hypothetical protein
MILEMKQKEASKNALARLLASENITVERRKVSTAMFNVKERILTLPMWSKDLQEETLDLLLGHEVGHALFTPEFGYHDTQTQSQVPHQYMNVLEDVRIEKLVKQKYPGLVYSFQVGYAELAKKDLFGVNGKNLNELYLVDKINLITKIGAHVKIDLSDEELRLLGLARKAMTFNDALAVALEVYAFDKKKYEEKKQQQEQQAEEYQEYDSEEIDNEYEDNSSGMTEEEMFEDKKEDEGEEEQSPAPVQESQESSEEDEEEKRLDDSFDGGMELPDEELPFEGGETDEEFRNREDLLLDKSSMEVSYVDIPTLNLQNVIVPSSEVVAGFCAAYKSAISEYCYPTSMLDDYKKFMEENKKVVSLLSKEFEMRKSADLMRRASVSKSGKLDMTKVHKYQLTDDIFLRITNMPEGKNHALLFMLDWSGSMASNLLGTVKQLIALTQFCRKNSIPFEVFAFTSDYKQKYGKYLTREQVAQLVPRNADFAINEFEVEGFNMLNMLSSKMKTADYAAMCESLFYVAVSSNVEFRRRFGGGAYDKLEPYFQLSGTPLNEGLIFLNQYLPIFKKQTKAQIVHSVILTDGEGHVLQNVNSMYRDDVTKKDIQTTSYIQTHSRSRLVVRDRKTNKEQEFQFGFNGGANRACNFTKGLLKLIRKNHDSNFICFHVLDDKRGAIRHFLTENAGLASYSDEVNTKAKIFHSEKMLTGFDLGYDEYFLVKGGDNLECDDEDLAIDSSATKSQMVKQFAKFTGGRVQNRVLLTKFSEMIA